MKKYNYALLFAFIIIMTSGCSTKYMVRGLSDFHKSSKLISKSLGGVFSEIIDEDMELRAEKSIKKSSISISDLEPAIISFENLKLRKEMINLIVEYSGLLNALFEKDHAYLVREYGDGLRKSLNNIYTYKVNSISKETVGLISTLITMVPEGVIFMKKKKFALRLMIKMQEVIEDISSTLKSEIESLELLYPNLYTRLFRIKVEDKWSQKEDKRLKYALAGLRIIKRRERFGELIKELLKTMDVFPLAHKKLMNSFKRNGSVLLGVDELLNYSYRLKSSYDIFVSGE